MKQFDLVELFEEYYGNNKYLMAKYMKYNKPNFNMDGNYYFEQYGGDKEEFMYGNKIYVFDVYKKKEEDSRIVFIKSIDSTSKSIDKDNCAQLVYKSGFDELKIESLNSLGGCIKLKSKESKKIDKQGSLLVYAIIDWAKKRKFRKITLDDESSIRCTDSKINLSYSLKNGYTLQSGYPWYWKFGFRYENPNLNSNAEKTKQILDNLKTGDLAFEVLIDILMSTLKFNNYIEYDMIDNKKILNQIAIMSEIYINNKDKPIYNFFKQMYYECCDIMSLITSELYDSIISIKNKKSTNIMVLYI